VYGRTSIADLFPLDHRCGIYVLYFSKNEFYCGQSVDVTRRYVEHSKAHTDIERLAFKETPRNQLNSVEAFMIRKLESDGFRLRNISLTSIPYGESDLDLIIPPEEQKKWCSNLNFTDYSGTRVSNPELRRKYHGRYQQFAEKPFAQEVITFLREYVQTCIPAPLRTEVSFWSCSCLPGNQKKGIEILVRINIYWQEVLTIFVQDSTLKFSFHMAKTHWLTGKKMQWRYSAQRYDHQYTPGGQNQLNYEVDQTKNAQAFIRDKTALRAIRKFNLNHLMKKGACTFGRYHCLDLADQIVPQPNLE